MSFLLLVCHEQLATQFPSNVTFLPRFLSSTFRVPCPGPSKVTLNQNSSALSNLRRIWRTDHLELSTGRLGVATAETLCNERYRTSWPKVIFSNLNWSFLNAITNKIKYCLNISVVLWEIIFLMSNTNSNNLRGNGISRMSFLCSITHILFLLKKKQKARVHFKCSSKSWIHLLLAATSLEMEDTSWKEKVWFRR